MAFSETRCNLQSNRISFVVIGSIFTKLWPFIFLITNVKNPPVLKSYVRYNGLIRVRLFGDQVYKMMPIVGINLNAA